MGLDSTTVVIILVALVGLFVLGYWLIARGKVADEPEKAPGKRATPPSGKPATTAPKAAEKKDAEKRAVGKKPAEKKPEAKQAETKPQKKAGERAKAQAAEPEKAPAAPAEAGPAEAAAKAEPVEASAAAEEPGPEAEPAPQPEKAAAAEPRPEAAAPVARAALHADEEDRAERRKALRKGLKGTRGGFIASIGNLLKGKKKIDPQLVEQIEEILLTADVGVQFTEKLVKSMKENLTGKELENPDVVWSFMRDQAYSILTPDTPPFDIERARPFVIMVIGVNGVGKTTTIAKLASRYVKGGKKVVLAAGDTFRAAAVRQLEMWGARVGAEVVKNDKPGADPSAVVFEAIEKGLAQGADVIIADTAGRLHTKTPLMDELKKVKRVMGKAMEGAPHEVLLVLDANTGQNAVQQVREFQEALGVSGIVLTKLDGTAKGGVILGICEQHQIPVRFIGVGERDDDLRVFDADDFVAVLFEGRDEATESAA